MAGEAGEYVPKLLARLCSNKAVSYISWNNQNPKNVFTKNGDPRALPHCW